MDGFVKFNLFALKLSVHQLQMFCHSRSTVPETDGILLAPGLVSAVGEGKLHASAQKFFTEILIGSVIMKKH